MLLKMLTSGSIENRDLICIYYTYNVLNIFYIRFQCMISW